MALHSESPLRDHVDHDVRIVQIDYVHHILECLTCGCVVVEEEQGETE